MCATIDDLTDRGINRLALHDEIIPLRVPISPTIVSISIDLLKVTQRRDDLESTGRLDTDLHRVRMNGK